MPVPKDKEIRVHVKATAVNSGDWRLRKADPFGVRLFFGLLKPKLNILGSVFSGVVESVGKEVKRFKVGDPVFGHTDMRLGAYAEYICLSESGTLALKPDHLTHAEAAVIPFGGVTAYHFIKKASIRPGQKVLIYGASGAVGSAAIQLARHYGAKVTGVCSTANMDLVRSLGADTVIDYSREEVLKDGDSYDVIFDTVNKISVSRSLKSLNKNGLLILSAAGLPEMLTGFWTSLTTSKKVLTGVISHSAEDIHFLKHLAEAGQLKPVIDRTYPLARTAEAHAYVEKGHKKGNVAITLEPSA